ncbi:helix-turn-helix domain-containing protein [Saccharopolyspora spinosa]|uniref:helix-turn-helix domain-containing protein n=1 Tax=Saccharopolyspora spinosa TaxID=60894 RepID=UPI000677968B|nr:helix-turn-helix transcriptional regulator [Saccharopolyspora spinosa]
MPTISPTVGRRWLAQEVRRLREAAGLKQSEVAKRLRCNPSKIGHMESMRNTISGPDLEVMLSFLGVPPERIDWYLHLADVAMEKGWWDGNRAIPDWFSLYIGLEWGASEIHEWDLGYVPGLLQTRSYAAAVIRDGLTATERHFEEQTELRLHRQTALDRAEYPLKLHAIVDEAALRRRVGSTQVMREQLEFLVTVSRHRQVTLQVIPFEAGPHRGQLGSFQWLGFPRPDDPGVVYVENQKGGLYLEESHEVTGFHQEFAQLEQRALSPAESTKFLTKLVEDTA